MLIEFPKNIGKSRNKFDPTDQNTSSILVLTVCCCPVLLADVTVFVLTIFTKSEVLAKNIPFK